MSDDVIQWCKKDEHKRASASYTLLPIHHASSESSHAQDDRLSLKFTQKLRQHRNRYKINRDIRDVRRTCSDSVESERTCVSSFTHPLRFSKSYRLLNLCLMLLLHIICNEFITRVNCDELYDIEGARGHYTHTWAVHIPGGDEIAAKVAEDHNMHLRGKIFDDHYHFEHKSLTKRSIEPSNHHQRRLDEDGRVVWSKQQRAKSRQKRDFTRLKPVKSLATLLNDPKWPSMWYLNRGGGYDMNVIPAWKEGITGKGVVVTILDDGLETDHPDLERNYDPEASYDVNSHDADPMPHYDLTDSNRHGTRCAGEVAATANNSLCSVGIAFNAKVGGVRMLDGDVTDAVEAASLGLKSQHIDIYSASWGPDDDGKTVDGPGEMATKAFIDGVTKGRGGKGNIFIWASGNGGREQDNCNCDGYTNSIWTLSISSATEFGDIPWYSEKCSSTLATTYSSGQQNEKQVVTTDLHHMCTSSHTGTSASAPLAAGIAALVLEANPNLTWRDLQHIVVRTANPAYLGKSPTEWTTNGVGRKVSHSFGYGLMDAAAMVRLARVWETVPEQQRCEIHSPHLDKPIPPRRNVTFTLKVDHCKGVNFLEHVQARISLTTQRRGDIVIYLTSPSGTRTCLLTERIHDVSRSGFNDWPFMTVHQWGESPQGIWELEIHNKGRYMEFALIRGWTLVLYGTVISPQKNDEPRQSSSMPGLIYNSNTFYRPNTNNYGTTNPYINRNQQTLQKSTTVPAQSPARKNGKQKNNRKGNKNNQRTTTTPKPIYTTVMLNQFSVGAKSTKNKSKISQSVSSTNYGRPTSTIRPRTTARITPVKFDYSGGKNNLFSSHADKLQPANSNIFEKSPGKAPKQVKETIPSSTLSPMSKMFERYEKIEQIYPELKPYKDNNSPTYFTVTNGKPSRENSKSFSSGLVSMNSAPQKKNSPSDILTMTPQQVIAQAAKEKDGKVQITQWNLIFHGTNDPPQKNDPPRLGKKKTVNDLVHNSLENSQWGFITQDVTDADAHLDVQRTVDRDRTTSSSCQRYSDFNKNYCLECKSSFLFAGKCFDECPERTFIVPERVSTSNIRSKGLSLRKRGMNVDEFDNLSDILGRSESLVENRAVMLASNQKMCGSCHESCLKCTGELDSDCVSCDENYNQIIIGSNINCVRKMNNTTTSLLESIENELRNYSTLKIILISLAIGVLLFITCISIYLLCRKYNFVKTSQQDRDTNFSNKYSYNQLLQESEEIIFSKSPNIPIKLSNNYDDDDDDDESDDEEEQRLKL
ncbi:CLUMA_CG018231, isoform A [Clunio marinus]|uniref:furin n=1 Tax=Clunio marinus TaxID=568069 RepID=A0A1J1IXS2_9DIPT|nr:CLUMA_CG018231, isoform A [Clunio marinus]